MHPSKSQPEEQNLTWQALYQGMTALGETLDPQRVLETALEGSAAVITSLGGQPERLVSAVLLFPEDQTQPRMLRVVAMQGLSTEDCAVELPGIAGLIGQAIREGETCLSKEVEGDPELVEFASLRSCTAFCCIRLGKSPPDGILLYGYPEARFFTAERCQFLELLARQTWLALTNARRFRESQLKIDRILDFQELNRVEIARELHDGPIQSVAALAMRVSIARRLAARDTNSILDELAKIEAVARQATGELRQLLFRIHPQVLESQGLAAALQELGEKTRQVHNQRVQFQVEPEIQTRLDMNEQMAIFNLVDQVLREVGKKEELENIRVHLVAGSRGQAILEIDDDGLVVKATGRNSIGSAAAGLDAIQHQVALLGGIVELDPKDGHGSCLRITFSPASESAGNPPSKA
jgi:signal transduction histidine kinase